MAGDTNMGLACWFPLHLIPEARGSCQMHMALFLWSRGQ